MVEVQLFMPQNGGLLFSQVDAQIRRGHKSPMPCIALQVYWRVRACDLSVQKTTMAWTPRHAEISAGYDYVLKGVATWSDNKRSFKYSPHTLPESYEGSLKHQHTHNLTRRQRMVADGRVGGQRNFMCSAEMVAPLKGQY